MRDTDGFLQLVPISFHITELQHIHTQHMHFWGPAVPHQEEEYQEYRRPLLTEILLLDFLFLNVISAAVTGNISVAMHPMEAHLDQVLEQKPTLEQHF